jgi:hypothetical protein
MTAMSTNLRDMPAWGISLVINLSILAVFHFIAYDRQRDAEITTVARVVEDQPLEEELRFDPTVNDNMGTDGSNISLTPSMQVTDVGEDDKPIEEQIEVLNPEIARLTETSVVKMEGDIAAHEEIKGNTDQVKGGVEGAMDRVAYEIKQSVRQRKTLVIWLFDASGSLNERRDKIAGRFENIYKQLDKMGATDGLYSAVVSFGIRHELLTPEPLKDPAELSKIVRNKIKEDETGVENTFVATKFAIEKFRTWRRSQGPWNKLVFIVTDERGDDAGQYLEETISLAKRSQTRVYTIGNAAPFGQLKGYIRWTFEDGYQMDIAVDQGPETAFPDGLQLPFIGSSADWKLNQISSGYGPYALTRLSSETGGIYLMLEDTNGPKFDRSIMRNYSPDYRPYRVQQQEIAKNPAKAALVNVAQMTYDDSLPMPELVFPARNDNELRREVTEAQRPVAEIEFKLRRMYESLAVGEKARDSVREPRWQAAFDLAMGRLLAMRVRYFGYNQMLANMKVSLKPFEKENSNMWRLIPSDEIDTGPQMRKAAEQARMYLKRVIDEHPGTPWALLAERELSAELGWAWEEFSRPFADGRTRVSDEELPRLLLAEEEMRREQQRQRSKPRDVPKL